MHIILARVSNEREAIVNKKTELSNAGRELGKLGAAKGGNARANTMTPEERSEIARRAVMARGGKAGKLKVKEIVAGDVVELSVNEKAAEPKLPYSMFRGN